MKFTSESLVNFKGATISLTIGGINTYFHPSLSVGMVTTNEHLATTSCGTCIPKLTLADLEDLANQFHLASIQIRQHIEDMNEGRRFELDQAIAFGSDKLEGDLPAGPENTD